MFPEYWSDSLAQNALVGRSVNLYFINKNDGLNSSLYRIDYDAVAVMSYKKEEVIDEALNSYQEILEFLDD